MNSSLDGEITDVSLRKLLTIASALAFRYAENGEDAYYITRRACVELLREAFERTVVVEPRRIDRRPRLN